LGTGRGVGGGELFAIIDESFLFVSQVLDLLGVKGDSVSSDRILQFLHLCVNPDVDGINLALEVFELLLYVNIHIVRLSWIGKY